MDQVVIVLANKLLANYWPQFKERVDSALAHSLGELTAEDVLSRAAKDTVQVWGVYDKRMQELYAVAVTEVVTYEQYSALRVITLGGYKMELWASDLDRVFQRFCREQNLVKIEAVGRKGLERRLRQLAFRPVYTVFVKEVEGFEQNSREHTNNFHDGPPVFSATVR